MTPEDILVTEWARDFDVRLTATQHMGLQQAIRRAAQGADERPVAIYQEWIGSAWVDVEQEQYEGARVDRRRIVYASRAASVLTDAQLSEIDTAACEWTDDWSERQELTPSKEACNAMFIRRVIVLLAAAAK